MFFDLKNSKVLLTGATGSIGKSIAEVFIKSGANLVCTSSSKDKLANLKNEIGEQHHFYKLDLNNNDSFEQNIDDILSDHKDINILINNAGFNSDNLSIRMKDDEWDKVISVNLTSSTSYLNLIILY